MVGHLRVRAVEAVVEAVEEPRAELARGVAHGRLARHECGRDQTRVPAAMADGAPDRGVRSVPRDEKDDGPAGDVTRSWVRADRLRWMPKLEHHVEGLGA